MRRITVAALAGVAVLFAGTALAQQNVDFSKVEIETTDLGNKTYMLQGQGGNITVAVGTDGIIMVDREFAPLHVNGGQDRYRMRRRVSRLPGLMVGVVMDRI
jgi:cyclase